jgi:phosphatidate cytidylyltransferase
MDSPYSPIPPAPPQARSNSGLRVLTALIGIPIVLLITASGGWVFGIFCLVLALGALRELQSAVAKSSRMFGARIIGVVAYPAVFWAVWRGFSPQYSFGLLLALFAISVLFYGRASRLTLPSLAITLLATLYVGLFALLPTLRGVERGEMLWLTLLSVWASDTAAYYGGRAFGRTPVSALSPGKTWEGMICGAFAATIVAMFFANRTGFPPAQGLGLGIVIAVCAPLGDLAESFWKRELGVKDLGALFPGHGGILDRCDSILFAALGVMLYVAWMVP